MTAATIAIIKQLVNAGLLVKDIASKLDSGLPVNWTEVLASVESNAKLHSMLEELRKVLKASELKNAVDEVAKEQEALLNGQKVGELSHEALLRYADLANVRLVLATQQLTGALDEPMLKWLVDALAMLSNIHPSVPSVSKQAA
jgi:hypothetical protein